MLWLERMRPGRALELLEEADKRDPNNAEILYLTGVARFRSGDAEGALAPLVRAVQGQLDAPFWAIAVPDEGDDWSAAATGAEILDLPDAGGDEIEASRVGGALMLRLDGNESDAQLPGIDALLDRQGGDAVVVAHRFAGPVWVAEVFSL